MRRVPALAVAAVLLAPAAALADYWVYCDRGRIEVEMRDPDQMRIARGTSFCQMGPSFRACCSMEPRNKKPQHVVGRLSGSTQNVAETLAISSFRTSLFSTRSNAENFARRNFGGTGGSCSCR